MFYVHENHKPWWDAKVVTIREFLENCVDSVVEVCEMVYDWAMDRLDRHHGVNGNSSEDGESGGHRGEDPPDNVPLENINQEDNNQRLSAILEEEGGVPADQDAINESPGIEESPPPYEEVVINDDHNPDNNEEEDVANRTDDNEATEEDYAAEVDTMPLEAYNFPGMYAPASAPQLPSGPGLFGCLVSIIRNFLVKMLFTGFGMARSMPDLNVPDGSLVPLTHTGSGSLLLPISSTTMASYHDVHRQPGHRRLLDAGHTPAGSRRASLALSTPTMGSSWASSVDSAAAMATTLAATGRQVGEDLAAGWRALATIQNVS